MPTPTAAVVQLLRRHVDIEDLSELPILVRCIKNFTTVKTQAYVKYDYVYKLYHIDCQEATSNVGTTARFYTWYLIDQNIIYPVNDTEIEYYFEFLSHL